MSFWIVRYTQDIYESLFLPRVAGKSPYKVLQSGDADENSDENSCTEKKIDEKIAAATTIANASTTAKGIVEEATQTEINNGTDAGATGARLFVVPSKMAAWAATIYEPIFSVLTIAKGGTNSNTALSNDRVIRSSGGAILESDAITAARALKSDANGIPTHFDTATEPSLTELGYVKGVTSPIQGQLKKGYTIRFGSAATTWADNTTYYLGTGLLAIIAGTLAGGSRHSFTAKEDGFVDQLDIKIAAHSGSIEDNVLKVYNHTQSTNIILSTTYRTDTSNVVHSYNFIDIGFAVTKGDLIQVQIDVPLKTTNPSITPYGDIYFTVN